jgi:hypothetical protein
VTIALDVNGPLSNFGHGLESKFYYRVSTRKFEWFKPSQEILFIKKFFPVPFIRYSVVGKTDSKKIVINIQNDTDIVYLKVIGPSFVCSFQIKQISTPSYTRIFLRSLKTATCFGSSK